MRPINPLADAEGPSSPAPGSTETLYASSRTRVLRRHPADGGPVVVIKQLRGRGALDRLRHELDLLHRVAGIDGTVQLAAPEPVDGALVLRAGTGVPLADLPLPMPPETAAALGCELATTLDALHRRGIIHRDVNPANVMVDPATGRPTLIDFDIATTAAEQRPGFGHVRDLVGTLPYLPPEQTGRTGWAVDSRADLYALGATLYELVTGEPPFGHGEPLAMVRAHLSAIPEAPAARNPAVPEILDRIILRLLAKEPDRRYQSGRGLAHDLGRLRDELAGGGEPAFALGEQDHPLRLAPSGRPVGRDEELGALTERLDAAAGGRGGVVLLTGAAGVGKTTVVNGLRSAVTDHDGWFVEGKFDRTRRDRGADGVWQAFRRLGRLLLSEPEDELQAWRGRLLAALGPNRDVITTAVPELAVLLDTPPDPDGTVGPDADARLVRAAVDLAVAVAAAGRPLVIAVDDLQWAGSTAVELVDALVTERRDHAILLIGAYRDTEVDAVHPLTAKLARWDRLGLAPARIALANLAPPEVGTMLADMLRLDAAAARRLADVLAERTAGNPFDTVELVNALRHDEVLVPDGHGWRWDADAVRRYVGDRDVIDLLAARLDRLPGPTRDLLRVLAGLGGRVGLDLLAAAAGEHPDAAAASLAPALEDGLVLLDDGGGDDRSVRFRHDRVRQAVDAATGPADRTRLHLTLARRLAACVGLEAVAAEQYLAAIDAVTDPDERSRTAVLLRATAAGARLTAPALAERLLAAAVTLPLADDERAATEETWHDVLVGLGRLDEADEVYAAIERRPGALARSGAPVSHIRSLCQRNRQPEALALGLDLLGRLGLDVPPPDRLPGAIGEGCAALHRWVGDGDVAGDLRRPAADDPTVLAAAAIIAEILPVAYFSGQPVFAWLVCEARRLWATHGPCAALVPPLAHAGFMTVALEEDRRTGYEAVRRVLTVSEGRGWEPHTSHARFLFSLGCGHWFDPVAGNAEQARQAREGLQHHADPAVRFTFFSSLPQLVDVAPSLEVLATDAEAALATAARLGDGHSGAAYVAYRQLTRALRGETAAPGSLTDAAFDLDGHLAAVAANPTAAANVHLAAALAALVFDDDAALVEHATAAIPLLPFINATYLTVTAHLLAALALAERAAGAGAEDRAGVGAELRTHRDWLAQRAEECPANYGHLLDLVDAERLRAEGDRWEASRHFDAALRAAAEPRRPLHLALIAQRAARFHQASGSVHAGTTLLAEAVAHWADWGATGRVEDLHRLHPDLAVPGTAAATATTARATTATSGSFNLAADTVDMLAVLRATQALSSATGPESLRQQVTEVLSTMTGADVVRLLRWDELDGTVTGPPGDEPASDRPAPDLPASVVRYVRRTVEPLLVEDATTDERFARDPYLGRFDSCSLLAVPVLSRGRPQALLLLEKASSRGAFSVARLEAVTLVAGQLAVSLENAAVYSSLEHQVARRTRELADANDRLAELARTDPLTGLANRRQLEDALDRAWDLATTRAQPVAVVMVDIDHFKAYNDHLGHQAGDACLQRVAATLAANVRADDVVARYGGEEFSAILPGCGVDAARRVAEDLRAAVAANREPHPTAPSGHVTISVGVAAAVPGPDDDARDLVGRADRGLYEAKSGGRDRVAVAPDGR